MASAFSILLESQFNNPVSSPHLNIIQRLKLAYPQSQHLSVIQTCPGDGPFPLTAYLETLGTPSVVIEPETHSLVRYDTEGHDTYTQAVAGVSTFVFEGTEFRVFKASWQQNFQSFTFYHLVFAGATDGVGQKLIKAVYTWSHELKQEMWVFEGGGWDKSKQLYKAVQMASWDEVVLDAKFKEGLRRDTSTFFASKGAYTSMGITWKRGILLLGPPGNGKTESIKALLQETKGVAQLYVKSFTTRHGPEQGIKAIFEHARSHAPCILILEDLDSMLVPEARAFFLNELDGLADNDGILTIATTNHPERIDDAILNRPSRFDVKYEFTLPDAALRKAFAEKWLAKVNAMTANSNVKFANSEEIASTVAGKTEGWSFAFLKELFVSFLLRMAHDTSLRQSGVDVPAEPAEDALMRQVDQLAGQIVKANAAAEEQTKVPSAAALMGMNPFAGLNIPKLNAGSGPIVRSGVNF